MQVFGLGVPELMLIVLVLLLLFGASRLPELGRSIGQFGKEIKKGINDDEKVVKKDDKKNK